jgi:Zn-dependent peptidase ImmA (M78 family)
MYHPKIEDKAKQILQDLNITEFPVPISTIAEARGLSIQQYDLGEKVSGVLVINRGLGTIGVNPDHGTTRQRFTIAHELGHYELHRHSKDLFIDSAYKVHFRDETSSTGEKLVEMQANAFAAAILMPRDMLIHEIKENNFDLHDETTIESLANKFQVSPMAMTYRIMNLDLF